jgi:hypothetical protein
MMPAISSQSMQASRPGPTLAGSLLVLIQFDVCEEIRLDRLQKSSVRPRSLSLH